MTSALTRIVFGLLIGAACVAARPARAQLPAHWFQTADTCMACHNGLTTALGEDVSIGRQWRGSMMANAARDPYWQGSVRREVLDHPAAQAEIEDECSICHMPMATYTARAGGGHGAVFARVPAAGSVAANDLLAADGASCSVCHQIEAGTLGARESFTGGFRVDTTRTAGPRHAYGPFAVDAGRTRIMSSATGFAQAEATHVRQSALCATCHTLFTHAISGAGQASAELPEQVPYLEWMASEYRTTTSCQACHMPAIEPPTAVSSVLGEPRAGRGRHAFPGANFFMPRLLDAHRNDLAVAALPEELHDAAERTVVHLQEKAATVTVVGGDAAHGRIAFTVGVDNRAGHKLPSAYPSRRAWLHVVVRDRAGQTVFESGAFGADGSIAGNDGDADGSRFEPHYGEISSGDQVQIYETVMVDGHGGVTTGLLTGVRYVKDNRLLPRGFDKRTVSDDVAVRGGALEDADFLGGGDHVRYVVAVGDRPGPFTVEAELYYQPIGFRWARNLATYAGAEPTRFVRYYDAAAATSAIVIAAGRAAIP